MFSVPPFFPETKLSREVLTPVGVTSMFDTASFTLYCTVVGLAAYYHFHTI